MHECKRGKIVHECKRGRIMKKLIEIDVIFGYNFFLKKQKKIKI